MAKWWYWILWREYQGCAAQAYRFYASRRDAMDAMNVFEHWSPEAYYWIEQALFVTGDYVAA